MPLKSLRAAPVLDLAPGDVLALLSDGIFEYRNAAGEEFGEERVEQVIAEHRGLPMAALASRLLTTVAEFAGGAPQEDDITIVLVKREAAAHESFARTFDSLPALAAFTSALFRPARRDAGSLLNTLDLALEELFTNMVKYSPGGAERIDVDIATLAGGIEVVLTDYDVDFFDVTRAPDANVELPIEQRRPGGLGLHLVRRMLDSLEYQYSERRTTEPDPVPQERGRKSRFGRHHAAGGPGCLASTRKVPVSSRSPAGWMQRSPRAPRRRSTRVDGIVNLDCTGLEYISSAGLGVLLKTQKRLLAANGKLRLTGVNRHLQDIFRYSGFDQIIEIEPVR